MIPSRFFLPLFCCAALAASAPESSAQLMEKPVAFSGPSAIQTFAEGTFFHLSLRTTYPEIPARMMELVPQLQRALAAAGLTNASPLQVVYHGMNGDPSKAFEMEVGVRVPKGTQASGGCQVRTLQAFTCATKVFTGSFSQIGKAYADLYSTLVASGKQPQPETRQMVLFWEGETSINNMLLIQIGIQ